MVHLWNIVALRHELAHKKISIFGFIGYAIALFSLIFLGVTTVTILPFLYHAIFTFVHDYLAQQSGSAGFTINVYHQFDSIFLKIQTIMVALGILLCFIAQWSLSIMRFFKSMLCLSVPIAVRTTAFSVIAYLISLTPFFIYFSYHLFNLSVLVEKANSPLNKIPVVSFFISGLNKLNLLKKAELLFDSIEWGSLGFYLIAHGLALFSTICFFGILAYQIRVLNRKS